jgi:hypothetical protein
MNCTKKYGYPQCMGAAALGDDHCTCTFPSPKDRVDRLEAKVKELEARMASLESQGREKEANQS